VKHPRRWLLGPCGPSPGSSVHEARCPSLPRTYSPSPSPRSTQPAPLGLTCKKPVPSPSSSPLQPLLVHAPRPLPRCPVHAARSASPLYSQPVPPAPRSTLPAPQSAPPAPLRELQLPRCPATAPPASGAAQFPERIATRSPDPIPLCTFQRQVKPRARARRPPPAPPRAPCPGPRPPSRFGPVPGRRRPRPAAPARPPRSSRHADCSLLHLPAAGAVGDRSQNPAGFPEPLRDRPACPPAGSRRRRGHSRPSAQCAAQRPRLGVARPTRRPTVHGPPPSAGPAPTVHLEAQRWPSVRPSAHRPRPRGAQLTASAWPATYGPSTRCGAPTSLGLRAQHPPPTAGPNAGLRCRVSTRLCSALPVACAMSRSPAAQTAPPGAYPRVLGPRSPSHLEKQRSGGGLPRPPALYFPKPFDGRGKAVEGTDR
jgi:hypothetical protein